MAVTGWIKGNFYTNNSQRENNAWVVKNWLDKNDPGWSVQALGAFLGNLEQESGINPGIWEGLKVGRGGWGLVQWTPFTNFTKWASSRGYANDDGDAQMLWIRDRTVPTGQWIKTYAYPISFAEFKTSTKDVEWLGMAWCKNFERGVVGDRIQCCVKWYNYFLDEANNPEDITPDDPDPNVRPSKPGDFRVKMPLYYYQLPWL